MVNAQLLENRVQIHLTSMKYTTWVLIGGYIHPSARCSSTKMLKSDFLRSQIISSLLRDWHICTIQCNCVQQLSLNLQVFLAVNAGLRLWEFKLLQLRQTIENRFIVHWLAPLWKTLKKRNLMDILLRFCNNKEILNFDTQRAGCVKPYTVVPKVLESFLWSPNP